MNGGIISTTIRQRGQLTIPRDLRDKFKWLSDGSVVAFLVSLGKEVKIVPYEGATGTLDWKSLWEKIKLARTFRGKRGNLSEFIVQDRISH